MTAGAPARRAAALTLIDVLDADTPLDVAFTRRAAIAGDARAFARALATTVLRRLGRIDAVLDARLSKPLPGDARLARALLRLAAAELLFLDTPAYAAVSSAVSLARADQATGRYAGLINAVLRRIDRERDEALAQGEAAGDWPDWLMRSWQSAYGEETAGAIAAASAREASLDLSVKADPQAWADRLGGVVTPTGSVRLVAGGDITKMDGFAEGDWWVQDAAAALPAQLLRAPGHADLSGLRVLDLCAAPGGKTVQLAAMGAQVTALDRDAKRIERLRENLERTRLVAEVVVADALDWTPDAPFDAVLLDAPCSATGTLRRRPDVAWRRGPEDVTSLAALQTRLIAAAGAMTRPGGVMVYCTCSLQPEEGEAQTGGQMAPPSGLAPDPITALELPSLAAALTDTGQVRTHPALWAETGGLDGFFIARYRRV